MVLKAIDNNSLRLIPVWLPNPPVNIQNSRGGRSIPKRIFRGLVLLFMRLTSYGKTSWGSDAVLPIWRLGVHWILKSSMDVTHDIRE